MITRTPTQIKHREDGVKRIRNCACEAIYIVFNLPSHNLTLKGSIFNTLDKVKTI